MLVEEPPVAHSWSSRKLAFMSGLSAPSTCALSTTQHAFLDRLEQSDLSIVRQNFPYLPQHDFQRPAPSLLSASFANGRQYLAAQSLHYRLAATRHWNALVNSCDSLAIITLSCGLEILNSCLVEGERPPKLLVIALGPVARQRPVVPHHLVTGSRDLISRTIFRKPDQWLPRVGHMNYLQHPALVNVIKTLITESLGEERDRDISPNVTPHQQESAH